MQQSGRRFVSTHTKASAGRQSRSSQHLLAGLHHPRWVFRLRLLETAGSQRNTEVDRPSRATGQGASR